LATSLSFLPFNPFSLGNWQHFLILDPQFPTMQLEVVHVLDYLRRLVRGGEVGKGEASKNAIVEVVIEGVRQRQAQIGHELHELFLLHGEGDVLDDNGSWNELLVNVVSKIFLAERVPTESGILMSRVQTGKSERGETLGLVEPSLVSNVSAMRLQ
jgi:hypothetical protein